MALGVLFAIWVVAGLLMGVLAGSIWKGRRPFGDVGDYLVAVIAAVITGLIDWYLLPVIGIESTLKFVAAVAEPPFVSLVALWVMRRVKRE